MTERFMQALAKLFPSEGDFSNEADDSGGETWRGIARNKNPLWPGWILIDRYRDQYGESWIEHAREDLELAGLVQEFYWKTFWIPVHGDEVPDLQIAISMFIMAVNVAGGASRAISCLQKAVNRLNINQSLYPDIAEDGKFGPITLTAVNAAIAHRGADFLEAAFLHYRNDFYFDLCETNPKNEKWLKGWLARA